MAAFHTSYQTRGCHPAMRLADAWCCHRNERPLISGTFVGDCDYIASDTDDRQDFGLGPINACLPYAPSSVQSPCLTFTDGRLHLLSLLDICLRLDLRFGSLCIERERGICFPPKKVRNNNPLFLNQNFILCSHAVTGCWLRERVCVCVVGGGGGFVFAR